MSTPASAISCSELTKRFGAFAAVDRVSFEVFNAGGDANNHTKQSIVNLIQRRLPTARITYEEGSGDCWCNKTQHIMGPDREIVARTVCTPGRSCYEETY